MSVIGLDFGTHNCSVALWLDEKSHVEVIADDLGSRTIPSVVAYRGDVNDLIEITTGQAAASQSYKNLLNTFEDWKRKLVILTKIFKKKI
jgi:molecular chaperone DnaK (HSP70)